MAYLAAGLSNNNVNGLSNPGPIGVNHIHNKVRYMPVSVSVHFSMVHFMKFMHTSSSSFFLLVA